MDFAVADIERDMVGGNDAAEPADQVVDAE
jgi:hypothetical protein